MTPTADRVVVFLDYQNVYMGARETFFSRESQHTDGQIDPLLLGRLLAARGLSKRSLIQVRV